jgi:hypothetical protein
MSESRILATSMRGIKNNNITFNGKNLKVLLVTSHCGVVNGRPNWLGSWAHALDKRPYVPGIQGKGKSRKECQGGDGEWSKDQAQGRLGDWKVTSVRWEQGRCRNNVRTLRRPQSEVTVTVVLSLCPGRHLGNYWRDSG